MFHNLHHTGKEQCTTLAKSYSIPIPLETEDQGVYLKLDPVASL